MLECRNIIKVYRTGEEDNIVLKGINFKVEKGEFVAIMGPSGSGKSTLMNIIGCLDVPTSGQYLLDGEDVSGFDEDRLAETRARKIGFVFQSFNLLARSTVMRNVMLPLAFADVPYGERHARAALALKAAALPEKYWEYQPNQLSGGMSQRVAIARALVNDPAIILADEPTGNLDTTTGEAVLEGFQRLHDEQGRTIIMITHEHDVADHANRIITLRDGNILSDKINDCPHKADVDAA